MFYFRDWEVKRGEGCAIQPKPNTCLCLFSVRLTWGSRESTASRTALWRESVSGSFFITIQLIYGFTFRYLFRIWCSGTSTTNKVFKVYSVTPIFHFQKVGQVVNYIKGKRKRYVFHKMSCMTKPALYKQPYSIQMYKPLVGSFEITFSYLIFHLLEFVLSNV
jgi:hypothetical protein